MLRGAVGALISSADAVFPIGHGHEGELDDKRTKLIEKTATISSEIV